MQAFNKIASGLNINPAQRELHTNYRMFGEFDARKSAGKVHAQMDDIWVRYGDINHCIDPQIPYAGGGVIFLGI